MSILLWLLGSPLGRIVGGAALCLAVFLSARLWLATHDAGIRHDALVGYVLQSKLDAAEAKAAEIQRQVTAGAKMIASYQETLKNVRAKDVVDDAKFAEERKKFEAALATAGRSCALDDSDLQWLHHQ